MARQQNIMRRGKSWVVRLRVDGEQKWESFADRKYGGEAQSREAARQQIAKWQMAKVRGEFRSLTKICFREFAVEWLRDYVAASVSAKTWEGYEGVLRVHLVPEFGDRYLNDISRKSLDAFVADWLSGGPRYQERVRLANELERKLAAHQERPPRTVALGRSPKTIANALVPLKEMLRHAVEWDYLASSPAVGVRRPRVERSHDEMHPLTHEEIRKLLEKAPSDEARVLILCAVTTGMRRGEILGLRWGDVDWNGRRIWVRRSIGKDGRAQQPKSRKSIRAIAATSTLLSELRLQRMRSSFKAEDDYVFASEKGTPLDGNNMVRRYFAPALRKAGLPTIRFHDLRHTFASLLIAQGEHPKLISEQLGHASVQITLDRYGHLMDQSYGDASGRLETALFGASAGLTSRSGGEL